MAAFRTEVCGEDNVGEKDRLEETSFGSISLSGHGQRGIPGVRSEAQALPCEFRTGVAGSGKTHFCKTQIEADPSWGMLCSTTGISAINLNTVTLNAILGYFDTASLGEVYKKGYLTRKLFDIREGYRNLVIDEVSMMDGLQLTMIVKATIQANEQHSRCPPLGIYLTGDFLQLPPVKAKWAFESPEWHRFEAHTTRLTKVWRQTEPEFLQALNFARIGTGEAAVAILEQQGIRWHGSKEDNFDGTTLVPKNDAVDEYNQRAMDRLKGKEFVLQNQRWGRSRSEWKQIPDKLVLKEGAYVMLLSNKYKDKNMIYANGDCGHVESFDKDILKIKLVRNGITVEVERVRREVTKKFSPKPWFRPCYAIGWEPREHWDTEKNHFVEGQLDWWPLRVAYASTIHRSQGLSLDRLQFDFTNDFAAQSAMVYVALSRVRTLGGLRLVGKRDDFIRKCNIDPRVRRWL